MTAAYFSYFASFVSTILGLCEPFGKKMRTILIFNFSGNFLVGLSYLLVGVYSGATICFVACTEVLVNYIFDKQNKKIPLWLIIIYAVVFLGINFITFKAWFDILALTAALLFVVSVAQSDAKHYRILYFLNSAVWIFYDFLAGAYGNLSTHIILLIATFAAMMYRDKKPGN